MDQKDGFRCECAAGFKGKQCEVEKDECLSDPCYQGSTCVDKVREGAGGGVGRRMVLTGSVCLIHVTKDLRR